MASENGAFNSLVFWRFPDQPCGSKPAPKNLSWEGKEKYERTGLHEVLLGPPSPWDSQGKKNQRGCPSYFLILSTVIIRTLWRGGLSLIPKCIRG